MTPPLPLPVRIAAGLVATAVEQARDLPRLAFELPVTAVSQALQASMRVQQKVTELAIKGDRVLGVGPRIEDEPAWATFDEDAPPLRRNGLGAPAPATVSPLRPSPDSTPTSRPAAGRPARDPFDEPAPADPGPAGSIPANSSPASSSPASSSPASSSPASSSPVGPGPLGLDPVGLDPVGSGPLGSGPATPGRVPPRRVRPRPAPTAAIAAIGTAGPAVLPGYGGLTIPQLRGKLRHLGVADLRALLEWEQEHGDRPPYVTMLTNRISTVSGA